MSRRRVDAPIDPDLLDATRQGSKNTREGADRDALWWNARDEDGVGLNGLGMDGINKMFLALFQEMGHLLLDVVADPRCAKTVKDEGRTTHARDSPARRYAMMT